MLKQILLFIGVAIVFFSIVIHFTNKRTEEINQRALTDLNLQLTGVVDTVINGGTHHGRGIIRLHIISSNIKEYDPRDTLDYYYCVIKNGTAEIYDHTFTGRVDTFTVDTKKRMAWYTEDGKIQAGSILVSTEDGYYDFIREHTLFRQKKPRTR